MITRQSAVSRRLLLRTAALSPLALAASRARASEATQSTVGAAPTNGAGCDPRQLTEAIAMLWAKFFEAAGKEVDPSCFTEAVVLYYDTLCWNMVCWPEPAKQARALLCAERAGQRAAAKSGSAKKISKENFVDACKETQKDYADACQRAGMAVPPAIVCG